MAATAFKVGDTVSLTSCPSCIMTVGRVPSEENKDLLKPLSVECLWLNNNYQLQIASFPLAMVRPAAQQPIGFKLKNR